jgi:hypothetical protein
MPQTHRISDERVHSASARRDRSGGTSPLSMRADAATPENPHRYVSLARSSRLPRTHCALRRTLRRCLWCTRPARTHGANPRICGGRVAGAQPDRADMHATTRQTSRWASGSRRRVRAGMAIIARIQVTMRPLHFGPRHVNFLSASTTAGRSATKLAGSRRRSPLAGDNRYAACCSG